MEEFDKMLRLMVLVLAVLTVVLVSYVIVSGVIQLKVSALAKFIIGLIVAVAGAKMLVYFTTGGNLSDPWLGRQGQIIYEVLFGAFLFFLFLLIASDLVSLGLVITEKITGKHLISLKTNWFLGSLYVIAIVGSIYGCYEALKVPDVRYETVTIKNIPEQLKGIKIAILGDTHVGPIQGKEWLAEIVNKTNALNPDLVLIVGDFADGPLSVICPAVEPLKDLHAKYGVFGIPGNHDYFTNYTAWMQALRALNIVMLENQHVVIDKDGAQLVIGGTTDPTASRLGLPGPDVPKTFEGAPEDTPRIVLTHQPRATKGFEKYFDLQLSGHTHGAHTFFLYPLVYLFNDRLVGGFYDRGDALYYVTRGSGLWSGYSQRIGIPSEITLMTLE